MSRTPRTPFPKATAEFQPVDNVPVTKPFSRSKTPGPSDGPPENFPRIKLPSDCKRPFPLRNMFFAKRPAPVPVSQSTPAQRRNRPLSPSTMRLRLRLLPVLPASSEASPSPSRPPPKLANRIPSSSMFLTCFRISCTVLDSDLLRIASTILSNCCSSPAVVSGRSLNSSTKLVDFSP